MVFNHNAINEILDAIFPLPEHFGVILYEDDDCQIINQCKLEHELYHIDHFASIHFGMTKMVITSPKLGNVVIKIPFNGYYACINEGEEDEYFDWNSFYFAGKKDRSDYCLSEYEKFKELKTQGLHCFVAKTLLYKVCCGVRVFIQEMVTSEDESWECHPPSKKSQDLIKQWKEKDKRIHMDSTWLANCVDRYKPSKVKKFLSYCKNVDPDILEDMHAANYGYRDNGTPAILDFSNFLD